MVAMPMTSAEVVLRAYALVQEALEAETPDAAVAAARGDLEVLSREDLVRVATALATEVPRRLVPPSVRGVLHERAVRAQLEISWGQS